MKSMGAIILMAVLLAAGSFSIGVGWRMSAKAVPPTFPETTVVMVPAELPAIQ